MVSNLKSAFLLVTACISYFEKAEKGRVLHRQHAPPPKRIGGGDAAGAGGLMWTALSQYRHRFPCCVTKDRPATARRSHRTPPARPEARFCRCYAAALVSGRQGRRSTSSGPFHLPGAWPCSRHILVPVGLPRTHGGSCPKTRSAMGDTVMTQDLQLAPLIERFFTHRLVHQRNVSPTWPPRSPVKNGRPADLKGWLSRRAA